MKADGTEEKNLTNSPVIMDVQPNWSPNGAEIVFTSDRDGDNEIYKMSPDGSNVQQLTINALDDEYPNWSPDGRRIAFNRERRGNFDVYAMHAGGGSVKRLTFHPAGDGLPAWSPDGRRIAFASDRDRSPNVFTMRADGRGQLNRTNSEVELLTDVSFVAYPILRAPPVFPRAMIVFEFAVTLLTFERGGDSQKESFLSRGWEPVSDSWDRVTGAPVEGLLVRRRGDELVVDEDDGEILAFSNDTPPPGWWEIAAAEDACLLLYGSGLGLDRIDMERVNTALQASACAAATARVKGWAELELVTEADQTASLDRRHAQVSSREPGAHILIEADERGEGDRYVTVYERDRHRCAPWFRLSGPGINDLEAALDRASESGAPPYALAAGLEALAQSDREEAERVVRDSVGL